MAFQFPDPNVTPEFTGANGITYSWDATDGKWVIKRYSADFDDRYVNETGDTMTGPLFMEDTNIGLQNGEIAFTRTGTDAELDDYDPDDNPHENPRFSTIKSTAPINADTGTYDFSKPYGLQIPIDSGNTFKHKFKVTNRNGDIVTVSGGTGPVVDFGDNFGGNQTGYEPGSEGGVVIKGIPTPAVDNTEPTLAVNKEYVDTRDNFLQQEIIELEEEIEALAPTTERGAWRLNLAGSVGQPGQFTMYDGAFGAPDINPNGKIKEVESIWFNELDTDNTPHGFAGVEEGDLLELFVDGSPEYGLWTVVGTPHYETAGPASFWVIDVNFQKTLEDDTSFGAGDLCRLKIFKAPEGGSATEFVRKDGDEMSGPLKFETAQDGSNFTAETGQARIAFENTTSGGTTRKVNLFQPGAENSVVSSGNLMAKGHLYTTGHIYGWGGSNSNSYGARIALGSSYGALKYINTEVATWSNSGLYYHGDVTEDKHVATKKYVDDQISSNDGPPGQAYDRVLDNLLYFGRERILSKSDNPTSMDDISNYVPSANVYGYFISKERFAAAINENVPMKDGWTAYNGSGFGFVQIDGSGGVPSNFKEGLFSSVEEKTLSGIEGYYFKFERSFRTNGNVMSDFCIKNCGVRGERVTPQKAGFGTILAKFDISSYPAYKGGDSIVKLSSRTVFLPMNWLRRHMGISPSVFHLQPYKEFRVSFETNNNSYYSGRIKYEDAAKADAKYWGWTLNFSDNIDDKHHYNFTVYDVPHNNIIPNSQGEFIYS